VAAMETCVASSMRAQGIHALPQADHVRLYALTRSGALLSSKEIALAELLAGKHPLSRCYRAVDEIINQAGASLRQK
jgi:hypothetical protein